MLAYDVRRKQSGRSGRSGKSMTSGKSTMSGLSGSARKRKAAAPDARAGVLSWNHASVAETVPKLHGKKMLLVGKPVDPRVFHILTVDLEAGEHFCVNISCHAFLRDGDSIKHCFHWTFAFAVFIGLFHWVRISQALWSNGQVTY